MVVLIVDDSRAMRRIQSDVLSRLGDLEIIEAENGVDAIHKLRSRDFSVDLVLVDWMMPKMNGITFVELIKANRNLRRIPVLMVTSCADEHMMGRARKTGVDGYLLKPFTREIFLQALLSLEPGSDQNLGDPIPPEVPGETKTFLEDLPLEERRKILDMSIVVEYDLGETILPENEVVEYFYYVIEGEVEEQQSVAGCSGAITRRYGPGECFAATELMSGDSVNSRFTASQSSRVGRLPHAAFEGMLLRYPEIGITLSRILASKARHLGGHESGEGADLSGALEILDLPALIQAISLRQKTCLIELPESGSELCFSCGQLVHVRHGLLEGSEAFFRLIEEQPRNFRLVIRQVERPRNIHVSTMRLLLECARRLDESREIEPLPQADGA